MNDAEIIKALECCSNTQFCAVDTPNCPLGDVLMCRSVLAKKAHDLIKRQQAEIEKLTTQNVKLKKCFTIEFDDNKLKKIVKKTVDRITIDIKQAENEAIREFAKELIINLDGDIEAYANAGHGLNVYRWLKAYLVSKEVIKEEAHPI